MRYNHLKIRIESQDVLLDEFVVNDSSHMNDAWLELELFSGVDK